MCGIVGIINQSREVASELYCGLYALQHRGKESAGIVTTERNKYHSYLGMGEIPTVFRGGVLRRLRGKVGIAHNRYGTTAGSNPENIQPIRGTWKGKEFWIAHNGNLTNTEILRDYCLERKGQSYASSDTGVIATLISLSQADSFEKAVAATLERLKGAFSLIILYGEEIIVAKDGLGIRPLCLGKGEDGFVVASESCALYHLGATLIREIDPGEILTIDKSGISEYYHPPVTKRKFCIFEYIYFLRPDSKIFGRRVKNVQKNMGRFLAKEHPAEADLVVPILDSGKYGALGFIEESGLKNGEEAILRTHLTSRTFIEPIQKLRERGVELKFVVFGEEIAGKKIVVVDDSIVRGTTQKRLNKLFRVGGAKEIHARIFSPPYGYPCYYGIDTYRARKELIVEREKGNIEKIREKLGLDSLGYLSLNSAIKAIIEVAGEPLTENDFCTACFSGNYPIDPLNN